MSQHIGCWSIYHMCANASISTISDISSEHVARPLKFCQSFHLHPYFVYAKAPAQNCLNLCSSLMQNVSKYRALAHVLAVFAVIWFKQ